MTWKSHKIAVNNNEKAYIEDNNGVATCYTGQGIDQDMRWKWYHTRDTLQDFIRFINGTYFLSSYIMQKDFLHNTDGKYIEDTDWRHKGWV